LAGAGRRLAASARQRARRSGGPRALTGPALGLIVPCRNEAAVLSRKLRNLAACDWPPGRHRIVVVDDGSDDGSAELAARLGAELFGAPGAPATLRVLPNADAPGKTGAIRTALRELHDADVLVLDIDIVGGETIAVSQDLGTGDLTFTLSGGGDVTLLGQPHPNGFGFSSVAMVNSYSQGHKGYDAVVVI